MEVEKIWESFQQAMGYSNAEIEEFKKDPKKVKVVGKLPELNSKKIVAEVTHARGCAAGHKVGDKFIMNAAGFLLTKVNPENICIYALSSLAMFPAIVTDRISEGLDPNGMIYDRVGCVDVGLECGGWGKVVMKVYVE